MRQPEGPYVPALGLHAFTDAYDRLIARFFPEAAVKSRLLDLAEVGEGVRVLDLGCGTGTLLAMAAERGALVTGIDADPKMLAKAVPKLQGREAQLIQGYTTAVDLPKESFDVVISSLFFHHLHTADKRSTLERALHWLAPGGRMVIADFARPRHPVHKALFLPVRMLDGFELTRDVLDERVPALMVEVGFQGVREVEARTTIFGALAFWSGWSADHVPAL